MDRKEVRATNKSYRKETRLVNKARRKGINSEVARQIGSAMLNNPAKGRDIPLPKSN
jgi:hypothetical protein